MSDSICLFVEVPVCAFRPFASREYQDTYPVPTPASLYGMLLSLLGIRREDKEKHRGVELVMAVEQFPERSKVFRKLRRGDLEDIRPDYQDILTDLHLWVWVRKGKDAHSTCLTDRLRSAFADRFSNIDREGGVSLGESSYLVDSIKPSVPNSDLHFVRPDPAGFYSLPVWVDHKDAVNTITKRFSIDEEAISIPADLPWFSIPEAPSIPASAVEESPKGNRKKTTEKPSKKPKKGKLAE